MLSGRLPKPGTYTLYFPTEAVVSRGMGLERARVAIIDWVRAKAAELHAQHPERLRTRSRSHRASTSGAPVGLTFDLTLSREVHWSLDTSYDGRLTVGRFGPSDVEVQRKDQMVRALNRKCPKLQKFKEAGARTVLVLEDADLALSNHVIVSDTFEAAAAGRVDLPDEVYQISTITNQWTVWTLKQDDRIELGQTYTDFAEDVLQSVTG